jgi:hypothetical protein
MSVGLSATAASGVEALETVGGARTTGGGSTTGVGPPHAEATTTSNTT